MIPSFHRNPKAKQEAFDKLFPNPYSKTKLLKKEPIHAMVQRKDLLTFQFYKKEKFTGSCCGIRYLIRKETQDESDVFALYTWNGPYAFASTPETERTKHTFPFTEESLTEIAACINAACQTKQNKNEIPSLPSI